MVTCAGSWSKLPWQRRIEGPPASWHLRLPNVARINVSKRGCGAQENPNAIPEGETPHAVSMFCYDDLVDAAKPGDRVIVTGIYKAVPMRINPRQRQLKVCRSRLTTQLLVYLNVPGMPALHVGRTAVTKGGGRPQTCAECLTASRVFAAP